MLHVNTLDECMAQICTCTDVHVHVYNAGLNTLAVGIRVYTQCLLLAMARAGTIDLISMLELTSLAPRQQR